MQKQPARELDWIVTVCSPTIDDPTYSHNLTFFNFVSHHLDLQSLNTYSTTICIIKCLLHHDISERMARRILHSLRLLTNTVILCVTSALRFYTEIHDMRKKQVFPVMKGEKSGVVQRSREEEPRVVYMHCYGHSINLAACDAVK